MFRKYNGGIEMLNLLIIDKDINNSRNLLNYISENSIQVRVHSLVCNLDEGIRVLNTGLIDITLINVDEDITSIIHRLHTISNSHFEKYRKSIIVLSKNIDNISPDTYIYEYVSSSEDLSMIFLKISEIAKNKIAKLNNSILLSKIYEELKYIGYNMSYYGARYLAESIALIYNNYDSSENLNKNIYPVLAKKYNKTVNTIKGDIRVATNSMFYECDEARLKNYFNFYTVSKPKPKLVIYTVLNKLYNVI